MTQGFRLHSNILQYCTFCACFAEMRKTVDIYGNEHIHKFLKMPPRHEALIFNLV